MHSDLVVIDHHEGLLAISMATSRLTESIPRVENRCDARNRSSHEFSKPRHRAPAFPSLLCHVLVEIPEALHLSKVVAPEARCSCSPLRLPRDLGPEEDVLPASLLRR